MVAPIVQSRPSIEAVSDKIDAVNVSKANLQAKDLYDESEFDKEKDKTSFRQFEDACDRVKNFYSQQHTLQTVAFNLKARNEFKHKARAHMGETQMSHLLQTAEALRQDGKPRWMQLVGLIHDLGKLLFFFGAEGQWDVVGDTFPVGCAFDERIIYGRESFKRNEDYGNKIYDTKFGIYFPGCGLENVMLSWGHDEYLYHIVRDQSTIPDEGLAMVRYHSFYPWHREGAYHELMNEHDKKMLEASSDSVPDPEQLKPYYLELIDEYFPRKVIRW
ncbi:uncharacterized protein BDV17DRAFT_281865 [Aspergillus undulatus]|uniref:uncharacterized protein n=1 Tax=Aspergillus undulatus TaxID=1810928 RepID=UPI003CCC9E45